MNVILQERDYRLLRELDSCGFLSLNQVVDFFFDGSYEAARKRTGKLKDAGYLSITELARVRIVQITTQALQVFACGELRNNRSARKPVSSHTINHELAVRSLKLQLEKLNRLDGQFVVREVIIDQKLLSFKIDQQSFRPDAFVSIVKKPKQLHSFFFEVDMGTESHCRLIWKVKMYERLRKSGEFARWRQRPTINKTANAFRVIFIIKAQKRAERLRRSLTAKHKDCFVFVIESGP